MRHGLAVAVVLALAVCLWVSCGSNPEEPARENELDLENPVTGGDPFQLRATVGASAVSLAWDAVEHPSLAQYRVMRQSGQSGSWQYLGQTSTTTWTDSQIESGKTYRYKVAAANAEGEISDWTNQVGVQVHSLAAFSIENGASYTATRLVDLYINAADAESLWIWNGAAGDSADGAWRTKSAASSVIQDWELPMGEGTKTVNAWIRYKTGYGRRASDTIDPQPVTGSVQIAGGAQYTATREVTLTLTTQGADSMKIANTSDFAGAEWEEFSTSRSWELRTGSGSKTVYVRFLSSEFGLESSVASDTIDPQPVTGSVQIAGGAQYTATREVTLTLTTQGADSMKIANTSDFAGAEWEEVDSVREWTLTTGDGAKTVYLVLKSPFAFSSDLYFAGTVLDETDPVVTGVTPTPSDGTTDVSTRPELTWTAASDGLSGVASYRVLCDGSNPPATQVYAGTDRSCNMSGLDESTRYYWSVVAVDGAGNESTAGPWWFETMDVLDGFVYIEPGLFEMGSPTSEPHRSSNETQHWVRLTRGFFLSETEVTQAEYQAVMGTNPSHFSGSNRPVEKVSWYDAVAYCNARSQAEGLTLAYTVNGPSVTWNQSANGYRLPTESEWEYACRAGTSTPFHTGSCLDADDEANYNGGYPYSGCSSGPYRQQTTDVKTFGANAWGLYDIHGNVWEWCWDWYGTYPEGTQGSPAEDPTGR